MKLIKPSVELWSEENVTPEQHIARCARVCYGHEGEGRDPKKLVDTLIKSGHISMLRHASKYFSVDDSGQPFNALKSNEYAKAEVVPYNHVCGSSELGTFHLSTNLQEYLYGDTGHIFVDNEISVSDFLEKARQKPILFSIFRLTFCLTTQISTSRELNRVSPNNIAERSTRYCSSKNGLEICEPWWWQEEEGEEGYAEWTNRMIRYTTAWETAEKMYQELIAEENEKPQDARGVLPLDTATKVVYTYSVEEWQHILDLRYYEHTGKAHPNAKLIMGMVRDQINDFAYNRNIDYHV